MKRAAKLTASEIAYSNYPHTNQTHRRPLGIPDGQTIHLMLGYDGLQKLRKTYKHKNGATRYYSVRGVPDKLCNGIPIELKTYYDSSYKDTQLNRGEVQLQTYLWMAGEPLGELHLYDIADEELEIIPIEFDHNLFEESINKAIELKE